MPGRRGSAAGIRRLADRALLKAQGASAVAWEDCRTLVQLGLALVSVGGGPDHPGPPAEVPQPPTARAAPGRPKLRIDLGAALREAAASSGRPAGALVREILALWTGPSRLTPQEYFYYRLYESRYDDAARRRFRGQRTQDRLYGRTAPPKWWLVAHDKLLFSAAALGFGLPTPEILATCHPTRAFGRAPALRSAAELAGFLREGMRYPFFAKPVLGMFSHGAYAVSALDRAADALRLWDGTAVGVDAFAGDVAADRDGYLFQAFREPHPDIAAVCGPRLATVRLVVIVRASGPEVLRAVWKVPTGANIADNYWRPGNILCALDPASGTVRRAIRGYGPGLEEVGAHPDSGVPLPGFAVPCWNELVALTLGRPAPSRRCASRPGTWRSAPTGRCSSS
jgi:hypothetical protein